jgi:hypothetical protein
MEFAEGDHASDFRSLAFLCQGSYLLVLMGFISPSTRLGEDGIVITCTTLLLFYFPPPLGASELAHNRGLNTGSQTVIHYPFLFCKSSI